MDASASLCFARRAFESANHCFFSASAPNRPRKSGVARSSRTRGADARVRDERGADARVLGARVLGARLRDARLRDARLRVEARVEEYVFDRARGFKSGCPGAFDRPRTTP